MDTFSLNFSNLLDALPISQACYLEDCDEPLRAEISAYNIEIFKVKKFIITLHIMRVYPFSHGFSSHTRSL